MVDSDEVALKWDTIEAIKAHARSKQENNSQSAFANIPNVITAPSNRNNSTV